MKNEYFVQRIIKIPKTTLFAIPRCTRVHNMGSFEKNILFLQHIFGRWLRNDPFLCYPLSSQSNDQDMPPTDQPIRPSEPLRHTIRRPSLLWENTKERPPPVASPPTCPNPNPTNHPAAPRSPFPPARRSDHAASPSLVPSTPIYPSLLTIRSPSSPLRANPSPASVDQD
jgi:hypothetical protein